ncbi:MAG: DUF2029 domain-containing protein [Lewinellaceae bacterium]|nr:DUF2029 domain-containing protein [Lewinellaceae bacterium]
MKSHHLLLGALALLIFNLGYRVDRADFVLFIAMYGASFLIYLYLVFQQAHLLKNWGIYTGIALRAMLLFCIPALSDDIFRFLWDGRLIAAGIHPFSMTPDEVMTLQPLPRGINLELYSVLNSKEYHTVYPPINQLIFALAGWWFPQGLIGGMVVIKLFLLAAETGVIFLLKKMPSMPGRVQPALAYALNPLVVLEVSGNGHFEGMVLLFLLLGLYTLGQARNNRAALFWALGTATKLLPILFLPLVWRRLGWGRGARFMLIFLAACLLLFFPCSTGKYCATWLPASTCIFRNSRLMPVFLHFLANRDGIRRFSAR